MTQLRQRHRVERPRLLLHVEDVLEVLERHLGLAIDVDDVPQLLQRAEDEERVDEEREELAHRDRLDVDQVEHQEHDAGPQGIDHGALDEAEAADVADLLQLELQDLVGGAVEARDLLRRQPQALHQLDVSQRLRRRPGERRGLGDDRLLDHLDLLAEHGAQEAERRDGQKVDRGDQPVDAPGVDHHEDDADQRREQHVDRRGDQLLDVGADLLQLAQRLAAALVLEHRVGEIQRVLDAVRVEPRPEALGDDVDEVVLEVLGDARDERDADRGGQQQADAAEELAGAVLREPRRVFVDDVAEDQRVEQREDLVDGGQDERKPNQPPIVGQVRGEQLHASMIPPRSL